MSKTLFNVMNAQVSKKLHKANRSGVKTWKTQRSHKFCIGGVEVSVGWQCCPVNLRFGSRQCGLVERSKARCHGIYEAVQVLISDSSCNPTIMFSNIGTIVLATRNCFECPIPSD